jgi:hypothetical protein
MISSNVKYRAREWSRRESSDIDCKTRGARVSEREASESTLLAREDFRSSDFRRDPRFLPPASLFRRLPLALGEREALRLFTACLAFLNVVSALAVPHTF